MIKEEKVCLTGQQIKNISEAYAVEILGVRIPGLKECPKAGSWVRGFYGKKKKKEKKSEGIIEKHIKRRVASKVDGVIEKIMDRIFGYE